MIALNFHVAVRMARPLLPPLLLKPICAFGPFGASETKTLPPRAPRRQSHARPAPARPARLHRLQVGHRLELRALCQRGVAAGGFSGGGVESVLFEGGFGLFDWIGEFPGWAARGDLPPRRLPANRLPSPPLPHCPSSPSPFPHFTSPRSSSLPRPHCSSPLLLPLALCPSLSPSPPPFLRL